MKKEYKIRCLRCRHTWIPKVENERSVCPSCKRAINQKDRIKQLLGMYDPQFMLN